MVLSCEQVKKLIEDSIPESRVEVGDLTGTSDHFDVKVVSSAFSGKSLIEQHKRGHAAVREFLGDGRPIHALQIKTTAE